MPDIDDDNTPHNKQSEWSDSWNKAAEDWRADHPNINNEVAKLISHASRRDQPTMRDLHWSSTAMNPKSYIASNTANTLLALRSDETLKGCLAYDEMLHTVVLTRPLFKENPQFRMRPLRDEDLTAIQAYLQQWMKKLGINTVHAAAVVIGMENPFHPIRMYLNSLKWDGKERMNTFFTKYFGAPNNDYATEIGRMFLISMVARVMQPGCKADYMVVLEGVQGWLKSQACRILAGEYFDDQMLDITSKDASLKIRGKWLVEWSEMRAYSRAETNLTKAFLTRTEERYRPPYGRSEVVEPRQCIFIGSTNQDAYLTDETGGRRFWPVVIGEIDLQALAADRNQLFAEATQLYRGGVPWWPEPAFEAAHIKPEQASRFDADAWDHPIRSFLATRQEPVTLIEVAKGALGYSEIGGDGTTHINRLGWTEQKRIKTVLADAGWRRGRRDGTGRQTWTHRDT